MTSDQPAPSPDAGPEPGLEKPPGIPDGMFLMPPPVGPGEVSPPLPTEFQVGLTPKDAKGHRWALLIGSDGTAEVKFRIPWQVAGQVGAAIAQGLAMMAAKAAQEENGGLIVPPGAQGGLFVARPGQLPPRGIPPLNGGGRG